jgi:hypothetical protein
MHAKIGIDKYVLEGNACEEIFFLFFFPSWSYDQFFALDIDNTPLQICEQQ